MKPTGYPIYVRAFHPSSSYYFSQYDCFDTHYNLYISISEAGNHSFQSIMRNYRCYRSRLCERLHPPHQQQIMSALNTRLDTVFADVTGHLFAELQDKELEAAVTLKKNNLRAAGTIAGIVLERHLQRVAKNHGITLPKESPTIADLNESLKSKGTYDVPTWRKIQLLSDLSRSIRFL